MRAAAGAVIGAMLLLTGCATGAVGGHGHLAVVTSRTPSVPTHSPAPTPTPASARPHQASATPSGPSPSSSSPRTAVPAFEHLPSYGERVASGDVDRLAAAAGMLEIRVDGSTDPKFWTPICNGTLVSINGTLRVMTAAHCLDYSEGHPSSYARPTEVTAGLLYQYGFRRYGSEKPAVVLQKAAVAGTVDLALFSILPSDPNIAELPAAAAIAFANSDTTLAGAHVDVTTETGGEGISTAVINPGTGSGGLSGNRLTTSRIYLGRIHDPSSGRLVDLWGDNVTVPNQDSCYFGGSGSSTVAAGGWVTGPMTFRDYLGTRSAQDDVDDPLAGRKAWRVAADEALGFDTTNFITVCSTVVVGTSTVSSVTALLR